MAAGGEDSPSSASSSDEEGGGGGGGGPGGETAALAAPPPPPPCAAASRRSGGGPQWRGASASGPGRGRAPATIRVPDLRPLAQAVDVKPLVRGGGPWGEGHSVPHPPAAAQVTALRVGADIGTDRRGRHRVAAGLAAAPRALRGPLRRWSGSPPVLAALGANVSRFLRDWIESQAVSQALGYTVLATVGGAGGPRGGSPEERVHPLLPSLAQVLSAWTLPAFVVSGLSYIDSPWALALARADKAGLALADVLCAGVTGGGPSRSWAMAWARVSCSSRPLSSRGARLLLLRRRRRRLGAEGGRQAAAAAATPGARRADPGPRPAGRARHGLAAALARCAAPSRAGSSTWTAARTPSCASPTVRRYCLPACRPIVQSSYLRFACRAQDLAWHVAGVGPVGAGRPRPPGRGPHEQRRPAPAPASGGAEAAAAAAGGRTGRRAACCSARTSSPSTLARTGPQSRRRPRLLRPRSLLAAARSCCCCSGHG